MKKISADAQKCVGGGRDAGTVQFKSLVMLQIWKVKHNSHDKHGQKCSFAWNVISCFTSWGRHFVEMQQFHEKVIATWWATVIHTLYWNG